ncbi:MAG: HAMP domain-containing sensor histidine kinase [Alphaproteobacteria bacterium]|nr:HAMP domain-containing sensor histidine kinase [Alphaproteobacteria bacterium]
MSGLQGDKRQALGTALTGHGTAEARVAIQEWMRGLATHFKATTVALYETGHSLSFGKDGGARRSEHGSWTGLVYFVDSWAEKMASAEDEFDGFPAGIRASEHPELLGLIDDPNAPAVVLLLSEGHGTLAGATARRNGAVAMVALGVWLHYDFPTILLLYFTAEDDAVAAATSYYLTTLPKDVQRLRERYQGQVSRSLFDAIGAMHEALGVPPASAAEQPFDVRLQGSLNRHAADIGCPDLRVYLLDDVGHLDPRTSALQVGKGAEPRRRYVLHRGDAAGPEIYVTGDDKGPIGWVLRDHGKPPAERRGRLAMHNRNLLEPGWVKDQVLYPGLTSIDSAGRDRADGVHDLLGRPAGAGGEYCASILVHPVLAGNELLGVIVANGRQGAPFVFREWDDKGLGVVARLLGSYWLGEQLRRIEDADRALRERAHVAIRGFAAATAKRFGGDDPSVSEMAIFGDALKAATEMVPEANLVSIRPHDPGSQNGPEFYIDRKLLAGSAATDPRIQDKLGTRFRALAGTPETAASAESAAEYVMRLRKPAIVDSLDPPEWYRSTFPGMFRYGIYAPVFRGGDAGRPAAIIDVRSAGATRMPASTADSLQELADMVGLALALADTITELVQTRHTQSQAFEDVAHQIMSLHRNVMTEIDRSLVMLRNNDEAGAPDKLAQSLLVARGQLRRASRVGRDARMFAELARTGKISQPADARPIGKEPLVEVLAHLVDDQRRLVTDDKPLNFVLWSRSIRALYDDDIVGDIAMFEQMMGNLIDNAAKYSYRGTTITVECRRDSGGRFVLELANYGYPIDDDEKLKLGTRGFRGAAGKRRVAFGMGIGLWLAKAIAKSFGAVFDFQVSDSRREPHRVYLVFPLRK